jgi:hypothetical protein
LFSIIKFADLVCHFRESCTDTCCSIRSPFWYPPFYKISSSFLSSWCSPVFFLSQIVIMYTFIN